MNNNKENTNTSRNLISGISNFINKYITIYFKETTSNESTITENNNDNNIKIKNILEYNDIIGSKSIILHKIYDNNIHRITDDTLPKLVENQKLYTELATKLNKL
jgi:hypothetical protein